MPDEPKKRTPSLVHQGKQAQLIYPEEASDAAHASKLSCSSHVA
jgi:hypothetical protein